MDGKKNFYLVSTQFNYFNPEIIVPKTFSNFHRALLLINHLAHSKFNIFPFQFEKIKSIVS